MLLILSLSKGCTGLQLRREIKQDIAKYHKSLNPMWIWHQRPSDMIYAHIICMTLTTHASSGTWMILFWKLFISTAVKSTCYPPLKNNKKNT